jgi:putative Holliday junction resolvase
MIILDRDEFLKKCPVGRLLGIDMGLKNIGLSITDETRTFCTPSEIIKNKKIKGLVIGLPLNFKGEETKMSKYIKTFFNNFSKIDDTVTTFYDERLTSFEADELMKDYGKEYKKIKKSVDKIASSYILESFLIGK